MPRTRGKDPVRLSARPFAMTPEEVRQWMRKATKSARLANATNQELIETISPSKAPVPSEPVKIEELQQMIAAGIRPTTDEQKLNQNEKKYLAWLETQGDIWIGVQCITLKLGHDLRYTPDFWALDRGGLRAIDTKGAHTWEDSIVKIKIAARLFPWIRFVLAKKNGEIWEHVDIKP